MKSPETPASWPEPLATALNRSQIPGLDALRAFAVLLVIFYHHDYPIPGDLGVLAFFVLSGFLITWLLLKEQEKYGSISLGQFYIRRALRIFPAFYVYWLLALALLTIAAKPIRWPQAWASFFYVNNYYQAIFGHHSSALSHTWSLGVEEQFYLFWPLALIWILRRRADPAPWLAGAIAAVWVWRAVLEFKLDASETWVYEAFDARADHLLIGCLLAVMMRGRRAPRLFSALCAHPALPALTIALIAAVEMLGRWYGNGTRSFEFLCEPLLVAALIVQWIAFSGSAGWRWLNWSWLVFLGRISYSTYLYQQLTPSIVSPVVARLDMVPRIFITLPAIYASAALSYWIVEKPFLALKEKFGHVTRTAAPAASPSAEEAA